MRTLKQALLLLSCPGLWLGGLAQTIMPPLEIRQDSALVNYGSYRGVPLSPTVGTPPGSDGRAPFLPSAGGFQSFVSFGSTAFPVAPLNLDSNKTLVANAANVQLPRYPAQGTPTVILLRARVGAPILSQQISFLFGSVVPTPETDEAGTILSANLRATYWQGEPYTTNSHANAGYYWSPHARTVFAVQAGPLDIIWKKTTPLTSLPGDYTPQKYSLEGGNYYPLYKVRYYVSGSAAKTPRKMYWTEGSFRPTGFPVSIPSTRVGVLNIVYNKNFPERVAHEYEALGDSKIVETNRLEETRTMWYDSQQGFVYAYNQEGRAFVELLGDANSDGRTRKHLGYEVVDVTKQPLPADVQIELGEKVTAYDDGRDESSLVPSPIATPAGVSYAYRHTAPGAEKSTYFANRETRNLNDYQVHWLNPGLQGVLWPTRLVRYKFAWPSDVAKYSHYVRPKVSNEQEAKLTAVPAPNQNIPFIDYQDPLDRPRANLTEKFEFYTYLEPAYPAHRTLIRMMSGEDIAFERVFSWLDQNLRGTNFSGTVVTNLVAWSTNSNTFTWPSEMTVPRVVASTVEVGQRISAPDGESGAAATEPYLAGYIRQTEGTSFDVNAYIDPFAQGFEAANKGAIIPINAIPGKNVLEVWWYRKNHADSNRGFKPLYWPSVIARYTIEWPASPREIVLASNDGSGGLESLLAKGKIYFQNDSRLPGYNPNEEHALMQGGQAFALRDDLNITTNAASYTSEPYVLLEYTEADARPAVLPFKVLREKPEAGITFNYAVNAGTILQPPMPLPLMEKPSIKVKGQPPMSLNKEVVTWSIATSTTNGAVLHPQTGSDLANADYTGLEIHTSQQHYFTPDTLLALQDTAQATPPTYWFYATNTDTAARLLQGVVATNKPFEVGNATNSAAPYTFGVLYTTASTNPVVANNVVLLMDERAGAHWLGLVRSITTQGTNKLIAVHFQDTGVPNYAPSAELGANKLMVLNTTRPLTGWRVSTEQLPPNVADQALRERFSEFTMQDRKGNVWVYRGPHNDSDKASMIMRFYYKTLPGFYFPSLAFDHQPAVGKITPYLRALDETGAYVGDAVEGNQDEDDSGDANALGIQYRPVWPQFTPVLNMAESLTLPKRGLPAVRGQTSLEIFYQQSQAQGDGNLTNKSVELHDPTREKTFALADAGDATNLDKIPDSIKTQGYSGRTYFPNLPPHLAERFFLDPNRSKNGTLVFKGQFVDAPLGDDYLLLNVLSAQDAKALKDLCIADDPRKAKWDTAITNGLSTVMEFFAEDEGKPGTYIPYSGTDKGPADLAAVDNDDVAVDSYALSAVGPGVGYVTLLAGNGLAFTKPDEPVSIQIIKVVKTLYRGEVKVVEGSNPLSEKLTLQQVTDLAGLTQDYGFEWKIASPVDGLPPAVYQTTTRSVLGDEVWHHLPYPLATDTSASVGSTPAKRLESDMYLSVVPLGLIPFESVATNSSKLEFTLASGQRHALTAGNAVTMLDEANRQLLGTVASTTDDMIVVSVNSGQSDLGANFQVQTLQEQAIADQPQSLLFRDVVITNLENFVSVWVSLDLGTGMKARVYLDNQLVVSSGFGAEDTALATPPPAVTRLAQTYRLGPEAFAQMKGNTARFVVELFTTTLPGSSRTFRLRLDVDEQNDLTNVAGSQWLPLDAVRYEDGVRAVLGGTADVRSLSDNYLIMRYHPTNATHTSYGTKSQWTEPQLAEGWIKRVLKGINPFNQRVSDLANNQVNTDVSLLTQAGQRWEGDVALNLDNINNFGLIEIYETVLRRGRMLSIDSGINYGPANDALLLAAGYLNDLYMMVGNEASADAANPTIGIGTKDKTYGDIATALFAFKGQVPTLLEEELALLRGRDDFLQPGVETAPIYNRLVWNYTRGIDSGEVIYALNYNIQENPANGANGVINADDARIMYPQGHGDAYGHYLTALKGYYSLMLDNDFDWVPRTEAVTVLGKPVQVDYLDERKFATAASAVARAGRQIFDLTWRKDYQANKPEAWKAFGATRTNDRRTMPTTRYWGVDHWAARTGQGAYLNWVAGNAILPAVDPDPSHEGIQKIDRTTVPELQELPTVVADLQASMDNAEAGLTPLGLSTGAIAFDVNPQSIVAADPKTHFEQVFDRAKGALRNAVAAFDDSKDVTRLMRSEDDSLADFRASVARQELAYTNALIEIFGTPYADDSGPGRLYKTGYEGPDLFHYMYVETPELVLGGALNPTESQTFRIDIQDFPESWRHGAETSFPDSIKPISEDPTKYVKNVHYVEYELGTHGFFDKPATWTGKRKSPGKIQQAISDIIKGRNELARVMDDAEGTKQDLVASLVLFKEKLATHSRIKDKETAKFALDMTSRSITLVNDIWQAVEDGTKDTIEKTTKEVTEAIPNSFIVGLANGGDLSAPARAALEAAGFAVTEVLEKLQIFRNVVTMSLQYANETAAAALDREIAGEEWDQELREGIMELRDLQNSIADRYFTINQRLQQYDDAQRRLQQLVAEGDRVLQEREMFRQRSAAVIQGFRTRDAAFRIFRNEKLERYKSLFDLAAKYSFLSAQAYDYETGLLHTDAGHKFLERIINSRALGMMKDGEPQYAGSNTGDPGLSSALAEMYADWHTLRGRLGFNNSDGYATTVSLRGENFRILPGADSDLNWRDVLEKGRRANLLDDADVRRQCMQISRGDGLPVPGIIIEFSTTIADGLNLFGKNLAAGDHNFSPSSFATKIFSVGVALEGYLGMDDPGANSSSVAFAGGSSPADPTVTFLDTKALAATPYVYLIPVGVDSMRSPPLGDTSTIRTWSVDDVTIPLPFNIGASDFSTKKLYQSGDSLSEELFSTRKHQAFRPVSSVATFGQLNYAPLKPSPFTNSRLIGRSVWNSGWKLVIPGHTLLNNPNEGLDRFTQSVKDIKLRFSTYSYSGN